MSVTIDPSADVDERATIGEGTRVWHVAQVREGAEIGAGCVVGRGAYVGPEVTIGAHVKVQNHALVYGPARLGDGVFVGPGVVMTNDRHPRAVDPQGRPKGAEDWHPVAIDVAEGASVGAGAIVVAPVSVGRWAMVGAGALVSRDVPAFALVVGSPARRIGWVGRAGVRLDDLGDGRWSCPETGATFRETDGTLEEESA